MREGEARRVQELPRETKLPGTSVDGIARDGEVDCGQMHPNLMRPSRLEADIEERVPWERVDELEVRDRVARRIRVERLAHRLTAVAADAWAQRMPIHDMTTLGWIQPDVDDWVGQIDECLHFFDVVSADAWVANRLALLEQTPRFAPGIRI